MNTARIVSKYDLPSVVYENSNKYWWSNKKLHRIDGPAIEFENGNKGWYLNGIELNESQIKTLKEILSCDIKELPLYMGDELFASVIENRFKEEELK